MTRLVLVRHGQGVCNVDRNIEGRATCRGLSELGQRQATALAARLVAEDFKPDVVYSSPIKRAADTASVLAAALGTAIITENDLEEVRPGEAEGMTWDQYFAFYGRTEGWQPNVPFAPGAEAWTEFAGRVAAVIDRIAHAHSGETVLIVAHGGVVDASLFHFFALDPMVQPPIDFETSNTSITEWERRTFATTASASNALTTASTGSSSPEPDQNEVHRWRLVRYNDASHIVLLA
jgi:2,3-bisphosphoglycerate-dependent phosphoglycerate mutase